LIADKIDVMEGCFLEHFEGKKYNALVLLSKRLIQSAAEEGYY
jgi:hypothetical protein